MVRRLVMGGLLLAALVTGRATAARLRVTGDSVNLRAGPGVTYERVGQVSRGTVVESRSETNAWVQIVPPASAASWVYGELIQSNRVIDSRVNIRSGPGISYRPVGSLEPNTPVEVIASRGEWVRIRPPSTASVWISADYVAPVKPATRKPDRPAAEQPPAVRQSKAPPARPPVRQPPPPRNDASGGGAAAPGPTPAPTAVSPPQRSAGPAADTTDDTPAAPVLDVPKALEGRSLDADRLQGEAVEYEGRVERAGWTFGRLSRFRLVEIDRYGRWKTRCFILGSERQLEQIVGRDVRLRGKAYWVRQSRYAAVMPDHILLKPRASGGAS